MSRPTTPSTTSQTPAEVGFPKQRGGGQRRQAQHAVDSRGRKVYIAPTIPDPGVSHGAFRVLQRTDGPYLVLDTRRPPGEQTIAVFPPRKGEDPRKAAELECMRLAKELGP